METQLASKPQDRDWSSQSVDDWRLGNDDYVACLEIENLHVIMLKWELENVQNMTNWDKKNNGETSNRRLKQKQG